MNILVPDSWLREFVKTKATPKEVASSLSLCSQSVERVTRVENDSIYEIEITTNRSDCLSVYGIARELLAALPRFNFKAKLKNIPEEKNIIPKVKKGLPLNIKITKPSLCPRFTAIIFDDIVVKPSPKMVQDRLQKVGIRSLNNAVDISNYLMIELGQPMHTFDYDKVKGAKMILRESAEGEEITTLDGQRRKLPKGAIIIEDGEGRIIDLCGIMGGKNSEVDEKTKRVLLFVQTYDPAKIRQTCQKLSFRTEAASRFEKGVDAEGVVLGIKKAIAMFEKNCHARVASKLFDIYCHRQKPVKVALSQTNLDNLLGIHLSLEEARKMLESLGFETKSEKKGIITAEVPHWRKNDIAIPEDLIEEVARLYGYHNIPTKMLEGQIPINPPNKIFLWEGKLKEALKFLGFTETFNYSMVSELMLSKIFVNSTTCLKIANPLNEDLVYLRPSLIPSLLEVISKNQPRYQRLKFFEMANIYLPQTSDKLPEENLMLTGVLTKTDFSRGKGVVETILGQMGISNYKFETYELKKTLWGKIFKAGRVGEIMVDGTSLGVIGELNSVVSQMFKIKNRVIIFDLDFKELVNSAKEIRQFTPISQFPEIVEDLTFVLPPKTLVGDIIQLIKSSASIIQSVELTNIYKNSYTFKITYQSFKKTLTDGEIKEVRKKIIDNAELKLRARLKG
jgi:phenylalanyl-tRNA synthetase beta chain